MSRTELDFHEELKNIEELNKEQFFSVLESKLEKYKGKYIILSERGDFYSEIMCLCGTPHLTVYSTEETAKSVIETLPECYLPYFKNSKVHQLNNEFLKNYKKLFQGELK